jgi:hypothetical protein
LKRINLITPPDEVESREHVVTATFTLEEQGEEGWEMASKAGIACPQGIDLAAFLQEVGSVQISTASLSVGRPSS